MIQREGGNGLLVLDDIWMYMCAIGEVSSSADTQKDDPNVDGDPVPVKQVPAPLLADSSLPPALPCRDVMTALVGADEPFSLALVLCCPNFSTPAARRKHEVHQ